MEKDEFKKITSLVLFIILNIIVFKFFPAKGLFQQAVTMFSFFVITPFLFSWLILKNNLTKNILLGGDPKKGILFSIASIVFGLLVVYIMFNFFDFFRNYNLSDRIGGNFGYFIYYELVNVLFVSFILEFFFRGFVMFNFRPCIGYWSIGLQWVLFLILLFLNSGFSWFFVPYIIFFPLAGIIAYKSRSIWYSLATQSIFIFIIDLIVIKLKY